VGCTRCALCCCGIISHFNHSVQRRKVACVLRHGVVDQRRLAFKEGDIAVKASFKGVWTTVCTDELMRKIHLDGNNNSQTDSPPKTMLRRLQYMVQTHGSNIVFRHIIHGTSDVLEMSFEMLGEKVRRCAQALIKAGVRQFDKVCIAGAGSPTRAVAYLGVMSAGAIPCALYATTLPPRILPRWCAVVHVPC